MDRREAHELLGVDAQASPEEIRTAFRRLIRIYHPDRAGDRNAVLAARVIAAYRLLEQTAAHPEGLAALDLAAVRSRFRAKPSPEHVAAARAAAKQRGEEARAEASRRAGDAQMTFARRRFRAWVMMSVFAVAISLAYLGNCLGPLSDHVTP